MYEKQLLELGIPANIQGFSYLDYAIQQYQPTQRMMKLYMDTARHFQTTSNKVERSMRHAIEKTDQNITNSAFVAKYKILWRE